MSAGQRVVIAGGHGKVARLLTAGLRAAGHTPVGVIRNPGQRRELEDAGTVPIVLDLDLEEASVGAVAEVLRDADAVVFAAGSGARSPVARSLTTDRDGAILFGQAAVAAGVRRFASNSTSPPERSRSARRSPARRSRRYSRTPTEDDHDRHHLSR